MPRLVACVFVFLAGCSPHHRIGETCSSAKDCAGGLLCLTEFPGGYCTASCAATPCTEGEVCTIIDPFALCLKGCTDGTQCRAGYQCFGGVCRPNCGSDEECGKGFICTDGTCTVKPGLPVGAECATDDECSSQACLAKKCVLGCDRDADCAADQTCYINPVANDGSTQRTTRIVPICIARRGTAAPGTACTMSSECDRGSCELGLCVEMCAAAGDCHSSSMSCATLSAVVDDRSNQPFKGCLPSKAMLEFDGASGLLPLPSTAQSFTIYAAISPFNFDTLVGITFLEDPMAGLLYEQPENEAAFYALKVRYQGGSSTSAMLVPNSPAVTLMPGIYRFGTATSDAMKPPTRVYLKLGDAPFTSGSAPLNVYVTDLSSACRVFTVDNIKNNGLKQTFDTVKAIFNSAGIAIESVNIIDATDAPNTVRQDISSVDPMPLPDIDNVLEAATKNRGTSVGLDVVLLRSITDKNGGISGVLGVAGGIPGSPVPGTPHSGSVVSLGTLCAYSSQVVFGQVIAHEIGHTLGLFHNREQDGRADALPDTMSSDVRNLMYWNEYGGSTLTAQQAQVMRNDPKVKQ